MTIKRIIAWAFVALLAFAPSADALLRVNQLSGFNVGVAGGGEQHFCQDIIDAGLSASLQLCVDAGSATSYSGSGQVWNDLSGNSVNFNRGTDNSSSTDDPTFNGSSGGLSSSEFWSFDGGDFFELENANPSWIDTFHKDGATLTLMIWIKFAANNAGNTGIISTAGLDSGTFGISLVRDTAILRVAVEKNGGTVLQKDSGSGLSNGDWSLIGVSIDENGGGASGWLYDTGTYAQVSSSDTWNPAYSTPGTDPASFRIHVGVAGDEAGALGNGDNVAAVFLFDAALTKANMDTIYDAQKGRFGL